MCMPNDPDELAALVATAYPTPSWNEQMDYWDTLFNLIDKRSPHANPTTPPAAGAGDADLRHDFERDVDSTGV